MKRLLLVSLLCLSLFCSAFAQSGGPGHGDGKCPAGQVCLRMASVRPVKVPVMVTVYLFVRRVI